MYEATRLVALWRAKGCNDLRPYKSPEPTRGGYLTPGKGVSTSVFHGRADRLQISVFVEPPKCSGGDSDENVYECFAAVLKKDPIADWDTERANTRPNGGVTVMYMTRVETGGAKGRAFNVNLLLVYKGKWVDMHTSIASPTKEDVEALFAIVNSAEIVSASPNYRQSKS
jgi:hypothetical protein